MSNRDTAYALGSIIVALLLLSFCLALRVETLSRPRPSDPIADISWKTTAPPEGDPILGMWGDTLYPRAHVCVVIRGEAFSYGPPDEPATLLERDLPMYWRRLP